MSYDLLLVTLLNQIAFSRFFFSFRPGNCRISAAAQKDTVLRAMDYWQSVACVAFRPVDLVNDYELCVRTSRFSSPAK